MTKKTIDIIADIGERVYVVSLETYCRVISIWVGRSGITYEIAYFHNGDRKTCYVMADEIEKRPTQGASL